MFGNIANPFNLYVLERIEFIQALGAVQVSWVGDGGVFLGVVFQRRHLCGVSFQSPFHLAISAIHGGSGAFGCPVDSGFVRERSGSLFSLALPLCTPWRAGIRESMLWYVAWHCWKRVGRLRLIRFCLAADGHAERRPVQC